MDANVPELESLEDLDMNGCGLSELPEGFAVLKHIKRLNLASNDLQEISKVPFPEKCETTYIL